MVKRKSERRTPRKSELLSSENRRLFTGAKLVCDRRNILKYHKMSQKFTRFWYKTTLTFYVWISLERLWGANLILRPAWDSKWSTKCKSKFWTLGSLRKFQKKNQNLNLYRKIQRKSNSVKLSIQICTADTRRNMGRSFREQISCQIVDVTKPWRATPGGGSTMNTDWMVPFHENTEFITYHKGF